jgi:3-deoxy-manno-octulosonate cytidylyltransferase (CMP-KDO synthetase)
MSTQNLKILCVIPSRIGSTRLPRKALLPIQGKPMVQWVYENAKRSPFFTKVVVATDSDEIAKLIGDLGGNVEMTSSDLKTGTDRVAKVSEKYSDMDVIVNLQGDEPFVEPKMIEELLKPYLDGEKPDMTTLATDLDMEKEHKESTIVKVITNLNNEAIYFSRAPIPYLAKSITEKIPVYHHLGYYAFRRDFLLLYRTLTETPLEKTESLEQLRVLEHGYKIKVSFTTQKTMEINTPEDLTAAQNFRRFND